MNGIYNPLLVGLSVFVAVLASYVALALRASKDAARTIIDTAFDAFVAFDASSTIREWNRQAELTFGWSKEEALGNRLVELIIAPRYRQTFSDGVRQFLATGQDPMLSQRIENSALHRDGSEFPVELTIWPVKSGATWKFNAFLHDINDRQKATRRLAAQTAAAAALVESSTLDEAAPKVLQAVCDALGWAVGALWIVDSADHSLHCAHFWHRATVPTPAFEAITRRMSLHEGVGIPGRVWKEARPVWVADVTTDSNFLRAQYAIEDGLHGAFGFPIVSGGTILGVVEFFSSQIQEPDEQLLSMMDTIGTLFGQFMQSRKSEIELETERRFLAVLLENLSDGIVACDERGILTVFNRATREVHGLPEQPLPPDQWSEHYDLYDADGQTPLPMERIPLFLAFKGEAVRNVEIVVKPRDRAPHTLLCNGQALISSAGAKLGAVIAMRDITESKRAEAELESIHKGLAENQQRLEEAQTIARIGSWEWDVLADTLMWSDEMHRIYGVSPDSFVPSYEGYLQRVHPDDRELVNAIVRKAMEAAEPFEFEHRIIRPDGIIRMLQAKGRVILDDSGNVVRMLGTGQDVTEFKEAEQRLQQLAHFDPLTALPNRILFYESLRAALVQATEQNWIVSVLFLDIDHFKTVNDTMGHASGDELLRQLGRRLVHTLRVRDTVGRLGGDEFAIILMSPDNPESATIVANKLREALRQPFELEGREVTVTASIGITVFPGDATQAEVLIKYADTAMYAAKEAGRDTYRFYTAAMNANAVRRLDLDNALRRALDHDEFVLHYQPKIDLTSGHWTGVEALLRWNRPGYGLVAPGEFIPLLEETGLIEPVGIWVVDAACRQIAAWIAAGIGPVPIAVNVSVKQLLRGRLDQQVSREEREVASLIESPALEPEVERALREHGIASHLLEIELTESTLMRHAAKTVGLLQRLKSLGIRISIDDFGTGYSSLAYLKRFSVDTIKIDQTFIRDISTDPEDAAITVAIISLAHSLKLKVVAEGVETREQLEFLRSNGCDQAQGYLLARPMPANAIAELFRSSGGRFSL